MDGNEKWPKNVVEVSLCDQRTGTSIWKCFRCGFDEFPDPVKGAREVFRTLKPGRTAIVTLWKEFRFKPMLWEVRRRIDRVNPLTL